MSIFTGFSVVWITLTSEKVTDDLQAIFIEDLILKNTSASAPKKEIGPSLSDFISSQAMFKCFSVTQLDFEAPSKLADLYPWPENISCLQDGKWVVRSRVWWRRATWTLMVDYDQFKWCKGPCPPLWDQCSILLKKRPSGSFFGRSGPELHWRYSNGIICPTGFSHSQAWNRLLLARGVSTYKLCGTTLNLFMSS